MEVSVIFLDRIMIFFYKRWFLWLLCI